MSFMEMVGGCKPALGGDRKCKNRSAAKRRPCGWSEVSEPVSIHQLVGQDRRRVQRRGGEGGDCGTVELTYGVDGRAGLGWARLFVVCCCTARNGDYLFSFLGLNGMDWKKISRAEWAPGVASPVSRFPLPLLLFTQHTHTLLVPIFFLTNHERRVPRRLSGQEGHNPPEIEGQWEVGVSHTQFHTDHAS